MSAIETLGAVTGIGHQYSLYQRQPEMELLNDFQSVRMSNSIAQHHGDRACH